MVVNRSPRYLEVKRENERLAKRLKEVEATLAEVTEKNKPKDLSFGYTTEEDDVAFETVLEIFQGLQVAIKDLPDHIVGVFKVINSLRQVSEVHDIALTDVRRETAKVTKDRNAWRRLWESDVKAMASAMTSDGPVNYSALYKNLSKQGIEFVQRALESKRS